MSDEPSNCLSTQLQTIDAVVTVKVEAQPKPIQWVAKEGKPAAMLEPANSTRKENGDSAQELVTANRSPQPTSAGKQADYDSNAFNRKYTVLPVIGSYGKQAGDVNVGTSKYLGKSYRKRGRHKAYPKLEAPRMYNTKVTYANIILAFTCGTAY